MTVNEPAFEHVFTETVPVFNLVPSEGEPARFGFEVIGKVFVVIDTSVRTGGDYGVTASVENATQVAGLLSSQVTLWGVPAIRATTSPVAGNASTAASTQRGRQALPDL